MAVGPSPPLEPRPLPVFSEEGFGDKFLRKTRENPLVPLGEGEGPGRAASGGVGASGAQTAGLALPSGGGCLV